MTSDPLEAELAALAPADADPADALVAAYEAGRRDATAAAKPGIVRLRLAAGVLLAATLGLGAMQLTSEPADSRGPWSARPAPVEPAPAPSEIAEQAPRLPTEVLPQHPQSYAALRSAVFTDDGIDLDRLPPQSGGGDRSVVRAGSIF